MGLTNKQYQSLIRIYNEHEANALRIQKDHLEEVRRLIPEYSKLEDLASELAVSYSKKLINGDDVPLGELDKKLADITAQKSALLQANGFTEDYVKPAYTCKDCKDTGYIGNNKCHCFQQAEIQLLYNQSNIQNLLSLQSFDKINEDLFQGEDLIHFRQAVQICNDFVDKFDSSYRNLLFCGTVGTGKSFLSGCIAQELLNKKHSVIYFSASELFAALSDLAFNHNTSRSNIDMNELYECELLVIDDLGTELAGQFINSSLFTCLNERYLRHKPIIISTNLPLSDIQDRYSDRVFSRIVGSFELIRFTGPDLRISKANILR